METQEVKLFIDSEKVKSNDKNAPVINNQNLNNDN